MFWLELLLAVFLWQKDTYMFHYSTLFRLHKTVLV